MLKRGNPLYADIEINEKWIRSWKEESHDFYDAAFEKEGTTSQFSSPQDLSSQPKPTSTGIIDEVSQNKHQRRKQRKQL